MNILEVNDMEHKTIRTDLIIESLESTKDQVQPHDLRLKEYMVDEMKISEVLITKEQEEIYGKKSGTYITIDTTAIVENDHETLLKIQKQIATQIDLFFQKYKIKEDALGLIVGLGNDNVTPDSLGPNVIENIFVTKHIFDLHPEEISDNGFRPVCAVAPGVMGNTGIETAEIVNAIIQDVKPAFVIVIDALAARALNRVNKTIQISDAGISPGSGVGNKRKEISIDTLGIPVISVGIPTVVDAVTITNDTIDMIIKHIAYSMKHKRPSGNLVPAHMSGKKDLSKVELPSEDILKSLFGELGMMTNEEKHQLIFEVLTPQGLNYMVTTKEIDTNIKDLTHIVSRGINLALHKNIN
ncbi:GPR endopeptidase [Mycoplasmatota bacterium]|nr:GPR endopeptidase [Mycoplasmatota bacterium]